MTAENVALAQSAAIECYRLNRAFAENAEAEDDPLACRLIGRTAEGALAFEDVQGPRGRLTIGVDAILALADLIRAQPEVSGRDFRAATQMTHFEPVSPPDLVTRANLEAAVAAERGACAAAADRVSQSPRDTGGNYEEGFSDGYEEGASDAAIKIRARDALHDRGGTMGR
ncbi:MAG: hypothetical protein ACRC14_09600 [Paracoccaceae bacterium]